MNSLLRTSLLLLLLFSGSLQAAELRVAVASNFLKTAQRLAEEFNYETGHRLIISSGSTGKLYMQIRAGAPYDLFLAADAERPTLLETEDRILPGSRKTYALGQLALWSRTEGIALDAGYLKQYPPARLALANAATAPYGRAAEEALAALGLQDLPSQKVRGENIGQTYQLVYSGGAEMGLVAYSQVVAELSGSHWLIPAESYAPIEQQMVIVKRTHVPQLAQQFQQWMLTKGLQLMREDGYLTGTAHE